MMNVNRHADEDRRQQREDVGLDQHHDDFQCRDTNRQWNGDRHPDPDYHRALFRTGAYVEYDRVFRAKLDDANPTLKLFVAMVKEFPDQLMLGTDGARPSYWRSYGGGPGLDYLLREFSERARKQGVTDAELEKVFVKNPARAYTFRR